MKIKQIDIQVKTKPFEDDLKLYQRKNFTFFPGITSLVGCNGTGKSTLIDEYLRRYVRVNKIGYLEYNDRRKGGSNMMSELMFNNDISGFGQMFLSSEGERIVLALGNLLGEFNSFFNKNKNKDAVILLDAIDSGMSVDEICEIRDLFLDVIIPDAKERFKCTLYIIIAANNYEWCNDPRIHNMDVTTGKRLCFTSYEDYKKFILSSRARKDKMRGTTNS